jgi:DNA-3-methyladenine glycosylase II
VVNRLNAKDASSAMPFPTISNPTTFRAGVEHICKAEPKLRQLVKKHGVFEFSCGGDPFETLVESIIAQQLNGSAAESIFKKLKSYFDGEVITAQALSKLTRTEFRRAGVSPQKIRYLKDLSARVIRGDLRLSDLGQMPDDEVVRVLDEVKGIGPWTAHMFLLFTLGRPDVLPVDDLGIQDSIRKVYALRKRPSVERVRQIAKNWHPYCSIASLYLWRLRD